MWLHVLQFWYKPWLHDFNYIVCLAELWHINLICSAASNNLRSQQKPLSWHRAWRSTANIVILFSLNDFSISPCLKICHIRYAETTTNVGNRFPRRIINHRVVRKTGTSWWSIVALTRRLMQRTWMNLNSLTVYSCYHFIIWFLNSMGIMFITAE